jgi:hypothetical protein
VPVSAENAHNRASVAAHESWARTSDRAGRTAAARQARWANYLERARELQGPDATPEAVERAAEHLHKADMARMSLKAAKARSARSGGSNARAS